MSLMCTLQKFDCYDVTSHITRLMFGCNVFEFQKTFFVYSAYYINLEEKCSCESVCKKKSRKII